MKIIAVIPARYNSSRFVGKPLALIKGRPMIQWVYESVSSVDIIQNTIVATDDVRIYEAVLSFGGKSVMTGDFSCGTERVADVCKNIDFDIVLNIQGDEPMVQRKSIESLVSSFDDKTVEIATLRRKINDENELTDPNIAKLIIDKNEDVIYFSRCTIPYNRDGENKITYWKHIGMYGFTKRGIEKFVKLPEGMLERAECLEQLRALENGMKIRSSETMFQSIGVDLPEHINLVEQEMCRNGNI